MDTIGSFMDIANAIQPWLAIIAITFVIYTILFAYSIFKGK